jgi:CheY-like chemotaxis protein
MEEKSIVIRDNSVVLDSGPQHLTQVTPPSRRVLVVDDNRDARESLATLLRSMCYEVATARDSTSALETATTFQPHVAILDIIMPGVSGFRTAELLRQQPGLRDITLISVTGWQDDIDDWLSKHSGCNYHLLKPLNTDVLVGILQKHSA